MARRRPGSASEGLSREWSFGGSGSLGVTPEPAQCGGHSRRPADTPESKRALVA
jgi:hypothetical protein